MLFEHQHPKNKSITVAVVGAPNVGKSTLINSLMGTDLSIVSDRPQTTRNQFHCVVNVDRTEIIFVDTPGLHRSGLEINKRMNQQARDGAESVDLNLLLIDLTGEVLKQITEFADLFMGELGRTWLVFTKSDLLPRASELPLTMVFEKAKTIIPTLERFFYISASDGTNVNEVVGAICDEAPNAPHRYEEGEISNKSERFFVTEFIREQAFQLLKEELPYEVAVTIDEYKDLRGRDDDGRKSKMSSMISASIHVNRPSQRAIVIGSGGSMIKMIGTRARQKIEAMVGGQVHLNLHVKVTPKWFKNNFILEEIGLPRAQDSARVWRQASSSSEVRP
ncbi:MAG: GTPase Era [Bdellovibrio sp.]|nr:GTPase Era [Bdellovibrio sp.]